MKDIYQDARPILGWDEMSFSMEKFGHPHSIEFKTVLVIIFVSNSATSCSYCLFLSHPAG